MPCNRALTRQFIGVFKAKVSKSHLHEKLITYRMVYVPYTVITPTGNQSEPPTTKTVLSKLLFVVALAIFLSLLSIHNLAENCVD